MSHPIQQALESERLIDITTIGRRSGRPSRIEIWFHNVEGEIYLSGRPQPRDWYANLLADPAFTFHLKQSIYSDLRASATPITDAVERARIIGVIHDRVKSTVSLDEWVRSSPLVRVDFD
jgi:hypothetical protein